MNENSLLIKCLLNLGEAMLISGAEINRIEDSLTRVGHTFKAKKIDVFVLTSVINLTVTFSDGTQETQTRRASKNTTTDLDKLEKLNALCRNSAYMSMHEFEQELYVLTDSSVSFGKILLGSILTASSFALFYGGNLWDAVTAGIFALLICFLQTKFLKHCPNKVFYYFVSSVLIGFGIFLCAFIFPALNAPKIIIGDIMLLIPGLAITNAVRDIIIGDTVSGIIKFAESLIWALSLAGGFMLVMSLWGGALI